jgi:hypothetical protein
MTVTNMQARRQWFREEEPEWVVWLLVIAMLAIGLIARTIVVNRSTAFNAGNLSLAYPADWVALNEGNPDALVAVGAPFDTGPFPARLIVRQMPATRISTTAQRLGDFALQWTDHQAEDLSGYKVLSIESLAVRGKDAVRVDYVYVTEPAFATPNSVPLVAQGSDILVLEGDRMTVASMVADADDFASLDRTWGRILASLELK